MSKSKSMAQMKSYRDNRDAKDQRPQRTDDSSTVNDRMLRPEMQGGLARPKPDGQSVSNIYQHQFVV